MDLENYSIFVLLDMYYYARAYLDYCENSFSEKAIDADKVMEAVTLEIYRRTNIND
jgi:hypothetical protein